MISEYFVSGEIDIDIALLPEYHGSDMGHLSLELQQFCGVFVVDTLLISHLVPLSVRLRLHKNWLDRSLVY